MSHPRTSRYKKPIDYEREEARRKAERNANPKDRYKWTKLPDDLNDSTPLTVRQAAKASGIMYCTLNTAIVNGRVKCVFKGTTVYTCLAYVKNMINLNVLRLTNTEKYLEGRKQVQASRDLYRRLRGLHPLPPLDGE